MSVLQGKWCDHLMIIDCAASCRGCGRRCAYPAKKAASAMNQLPEPIRKQTPESVQRKLSEMDEQAQQAFNEEFLKRRKSSLVAFLLLSAGFHYAYVGRVWLNVVFLLTCGGVFIWWIADLFRVWGMVREKNRSIAIEVLRDIQILR